MFTEDEKKNVINDQIEVTDSDELFGDLQASEIHEETPSKKFFLSNLSKKGLQRIWSKIIYSGKKGKKRLNEKIEGLNEELASNNATINKLEQNLNSSPKLKEINERITKIENSELDEKDKEESLAARYEEKQSYLDGINEEISKLHKREEKGQELLDYYKSIQLEKKEKEEKKRKSNAGFDDIKVTNDDVIDNIIKSEEDEVKKQVNGIMSSSFDKTQTTDTPQFDFNLPIPDSGLEEHYNNLISSINDLKKFAEAYKKAAIEVYNSDLSRVQEAYKADAKRLQATHEKEKSDLENQHRKEIKKLNEARKRDSEQYSIDLGVKDKEIEGLENDKSKLSDKLTKTNNLLNIANNDITKRDETIHGLQLEVHDQKMEIESLNGDNKKLRDEIAKLREQNVHYEQQWNSITPLIQAMNQMEQMGGISSDPSVDKERKYRY